MNINKEIKLMTLSFKTSICEPGEYFGPFKIHCVNYMNYQHLAVCVSKDRKDYSKCCYSNNCIPQRDFFYL